MDEMDFIGEHANAKPSGQGEAILASLGKEPDGQSQQQAQTPDPTPHANPQQESQGGQQELQGGQQKEGENKGPGLDEMMGAFGISPEELGIEGEDRDAWLRIKAAQEKAGGETPASGAQPAQAQQPAQTQQPEPFSPPEVQIEVTDEEYSKAFDSREGLQDLLQNKMKQVVEAVWHKQLASWESQFMVSGLPIIDRAMAMQDYARNNPEHAALSIQYPEIFKKVMHKVASANPGMPFDRVLAEAHHYHRQMLDEAGVIAKGGQQHNLTSTTGSVGRPGGARTPNAQGPARPETKAQKVFRDLAHSMQADTVDPFA